MAAQLKKLNYTNKRWNTVACEVVREKDDKNVRFLD